MTRAFDVVVVGARCAGATLGAHLGRAGRRVLVVDAADMPSDQPMSTHFIGPYGMALLDELGIVHRVRAVAPPIASFRNGLDDVVSRVHFTAGREGACIRRADLDALLVETAREHGATVELRTKVVDVLRDADRVVGVVVEHDGVSESIRAEIVVGADGRHSKIASLVCAEEYDGYDAPRAAYWAYVRRPSWFDTDPTYGATASLVHFGDDYALVFPANRDQVLVGIVVPIAEAATFHGRIDDEYRRRVRANPLAAPFADEERIGKIISFTKGRFFFRRGAGPGWALVGDAGLFKDFTPGFGITDAFRDARALARAVVAGGASSLERYWRERDVASVELFDFARDLGTPGYNNALNREVFRLVERRPALKQRIIDLHERAISPFALLTPHDIVSAVAAELLRGRIGSVGTLLRAASRASRVAKDLAAKKALVAALSEASR